MAKQTKLKPLNFGEIYYINVNGEWQNSKTGDKANAGTARTIDSAFSAEEKNAATLSMETIKPTQEQSNPQKKAPASKKPEVDLSDLLTTTHTTWSELLKKVESGVTSEQGNVTNTKILQIAKQLKDAGVPLDENIIKEIRQHLLYAKRAGDEPGIMRKFIKNTIDQYNKAEENAEFNRLHEEGMKRITEENRKKPSGYTDTPHMKSPQGKPPPAEPEDTRTHWEKLADQYQHEAEEISRDIQDVIGNVTSLFTGKRPASASSMAQSVADSPFRRMYKQKLRSIHPLLPLISGRLQGMSKSVSPTKTSTSHIRPKTHRPDFGEIAQVLGVHAATNEDHIPEYVSDKSTHAQPEPTTSTTEDGSGNKDFLALLRQIETNTRASLSLLARVISPNSSVAKQTFSGVAGGSQPTTTKANDGIISTIQSIFGKSSTEDTEKETTPQDITNSRGRFSGLGRLVPDYFKSSSRKIDNEEESETSKMKEEEKQSSAEKPIKVEISNPDDIGKSISEDIKDDQHNQTQNKETKSPRKLSELTDAEKERLENLGYKESGIGYRKPSGKMATKENIFKTLESPRKLSELTDAEKETLSAKGFKPQGIGYSHPEGGMATKEQLFKSLSTDATVEGAAGAAEGIGAAGAAEAAGLAIPGIGELIAAGMLAKGVWDIGTGITRNVLGGGTNAYFGYGTDMAKKSKYAKGGIVNNMSVNAFADGGIVDKPTLFNHSAGQGLMGEAGSEAIMPLKRGSDGKLGVASGEMNKPKVMDESIALKKATDMKNDISGSSNGQQPVIINDNKTINNGNGGGGQSMAILGSSTAGPRNSLDLNYFAR